FLLPRNHPEQRRLAGAVRSDDADDAAAREREVEPVDEDVVVIAFTQTACLDDGVAKPRARGDVDLSGLDLLRRVLFEQILVGVEARLALRLARAGRHADPFELALERFLPPRLGLLLLREPPLFLLQPGGVVALPGDAAAAIELQNPAGDVV